MAVPGTVTRPDGVVLAYEDTGGDGPVVVLTHGFTLTLRMWDPTVDALAAAGWRVVTWDARGHGRTVTPADRRPSSCWARRTSPSWRPPR